MEGENEDGRKRVKQRNGSKESGEIAVNIFIKRCHNAVDYLYCKIHFAEGGKRKVFYHWI